MFLHKMSSLRSALPQGAALPWHFFLFAFIFVWRAIRLHATAHAVMNVAIMIVAQAPRYPAHGCVRRGAWRLWFVDWQLAPGPGAWRLAAGAYTLACCVCGVGGNGGVLFFV